MSDGKTEINKEEIYKLQGYYNTSLEKLFSKVNLLIAKVKDLKEENNSLREGIKDFNNSITDLKLQLTKANSDSVLKDKEISSLKNLLLNSEVNKTSIQNKDQVKSRIKELIDRIDSHLEQYDENLKEDED
ncbi:MAG: hypothetical protein HY959_00820 [Ignavibacteriae bacterium]|nr:hypothetical protein [Ignavibacteriota bacterium]